MSTERTSRLKLVKKLEEIKNSSTKNYSNNDLYFF